MVYPQLKLPGKHSNTTLLMKDNAAYSLLVEMIDRNVYEFTICVYDTDDATEAKRHEYVLHCSKKSLRDLKKTLEGLLK